MSATLATSRIVRRTDFDRGGHFGALEAADLLTLPSAAGEGRQHVDVGAVG